MIDIHKQVEFWRNSSVEDWQVALELFKIRRLRHSLFFVHLALEKILKAHVCRQIQELAPRIHNLVRLAEIAGLELNDKQLDVLAELNSFNIEGRYPNLPVQTPTPEEANAYVQRAEEVYQWLLGRLP